MISKNLHDLIDLLCDSLSTAKTGTDGKKTCIIELKKLPQVYQEELIEFVSEEVDAGGLSCEDDNYHIISIDDSIWNVWVDEDIDSGSFTPRGIVAIVDDETEKYAIIDLLTDVAHSLYALNK